MKALSLKQPYAELILQGRKTIELRNWNTSFRGPFLLHASKNAHAQAMRQHNFITLPTGGIVGRAFLHEVKKYANVEEHVADKDKHLANADWGSYGFLLKNVQRLPFQPYKGKLNFWESGLNA